MKVISVYNEVRELKERLIETWIWNRKALSRHGRKLVFFSATAEGK